MSCGKNITPDVMKKIWHLCKLGQSAEEMAYLLGVSAASVHRVRTIMTAVDEDDQETLNTSYMDCGYLKEYALEILGKKKQEAVEVVAEETNEAQAMVNILKRVDKMADLLEKLCKALGVEGV